MYKDELMHYGVKGMKWGVRKDQASGGGISRDRVREKIDNATTTSVKVGKDKSPISPAEKIVRDSGRIVDEANKLSRNTDKKKKKAKSDAKKMSDAELRKAIDRMRLEQQYSELKAQDLSAGEERAQKILSTTGSILMIASTGLSIYSTIKKL